MAIAFDAATDGGINFGASTITWDHTCSGSDRMLFVFCCYVCVDGDPGGTAVCTYNGVSMTLEGSSVQPSGSFVQSVWLFSLKNPATGTNQVGFGLTTGASPAATLGLSASYTGVDDVTAVNDFADTTSTYSNNVTPTVAGSWTFMGVKVDNDTPSAGTGSNDLISTSNGMGIYDSGGTVGTGSPYVMEATGTGSHRWDGVMLAFSPTGGGGGTTFPGYIAPFGWT